MRARAASAMQITFFTLYLSVNNNRSSPSSSHGPCCLRWWTTLLVSSTIEVNAALAILKRVVPSPAHPRIIPGVAAGSPDVETASLSVVKGRRYSESRRQSVPRTLFLLRVIIRSTKSIRSAEFRERNPERESESRANQSGRTIYVARPVNPRE